MSPRWRASLLLIACLLLSAPRPAAASGHLPDLGLIGLILAVPLLLVATDVGLAGYDLVSLSQKQQPDHGAAIAEVVLAGPQLAVSASLLRKDNARYLAPVVVVSAGLLAHGIWALATQSSSDSQQALVMPLLNRRF